MAVGGVVILFIGLFLGIFGAVPLVMVSNGTITWAEILQNSGMTESRAYLQLAIGIPVLIAGAIVLWRAIKGEEL
jgi:hypothetical protein